MEELELNLKEQLNNITNKIINLQAEQKIIRDKISSLNIKKSREKNLNLIEKEVFREKDVYKGSKWNRIYNTIKEYGIIQVCDGQIKSLKGGKWLSIGKLVVVSKTGNSVLGYYDNSWKLVD